MGDGLHSGGDPCQAFFLFGIGELDREMAWDPPFLPLQSIREGSTVPLEQEDLREPTAQCQGLVWQAWTLELCAACRHGNFRQEMARSVGAKSTGSRLQVGQEAGPGRVTTRFSRVKEGPGPRIISDSSLG